MKKPFFTNPEAAEYAFYVAIEGADLEAMMTVWEPSETIVCIHPLGPRLQGPQQIRASWRQILNSGVRLRFRIEGVQGLMQGDLAVRIVYEHITVLGTDEQPAQPVIATNIYRRTPVGWHIILHHASPGPAITVSHDSLPERLH